MPHRAEAMLLPFAAPADRHGLRPYQKEAVGAALKHIRTRTDPGVVATHTGSGKTRTAIAIIDEWLAENPGDRCLWVTNRTVLIEDAKARLSRTLGAFSVGREQARWRADGERVVVGSLQTLKDDRLLAIDPGAFGLIVWDECQFWDSDPAKAILRHFKRARLIGLSATPTTGEVIYERTLIWGIEQGFAVPFVCKSERIVGLDISRVKTAKNAQGVRDLQISALEEAILKVAAPIAAHVWEYCKDRRPIIYTPGVASAHAIAKALNERRAGWIESVDAKTPPKERVRIQRACEAGEIGGITNCGIYLYGYDAPWCDAIVLGRLTEDWGTWMQQIGRGVRPEGWIGQLDSAEERTAAIAASKKPNMLLLDLTGDAGRHKVCGPTSIDRTLDADVRERAEKKLRDDSSLTVTDAIKDAKAWKRGEYDRLAKLALQVKIKSESGTFDPFHAAGVTPGYKAHAPVWAREPVSTSQAYWLRLRKLPEDISRGEYNKFRKAEDEWVANGRATYSQRMQLSALNLPDDMSFQQAADLLYACPIVWKNRQRVRSAPPREAVERILMSAAAPKQLEEESRW